MRLHTEAAHTHKRCKGRDPARREGEGSGRQAAAAPLPPKGQLLHTRIPKARLSFSFRLVDNRKAAQRACGGPRRKEKLARGAHADLSAPTFAAPTHSPPFVSLSPPPASAKRLLQRGKVLHGALGVGLHALVALLPVCFLVFDFRFWFWG